MGETKLLSGLLSHTTHVSVRSDGIPVSCSPRKKPRRQQSTSEAAPRRFRARVKQGFPATRRLLVIFILVYLGEHSQSLATLGAMRCTMMLHRCCEGSHPVILAIAPQSRSLATVCSGMGVLDWPVQARTIKKMQCAA